MSRTLFYNNFIFDLLFICWIYRKIWDLLTNLFCGFKLIPTFAPLVKVKNEEFGYHIKRCNPTRRCHFASEVRMLHAGKPDSHSHQAGMAFFIL
ncbi:MAG: hypothetical protein ACK5JD_14790 [Mangrovibacterium sp.]